MNKTPEELAEEYLRYESESHYWTKQAFLAGYKAAKDQLADADKVMPDTCEHILDMSKMVDVNGWISVGDKLPELDEDVLVWYGYSCEVACRRRFHPPKLKPPQFNNVELFVWDFGDFEDFDVTHWMPLPEPPKEEG